MMVITDSLKSIFSDTGTDLISGEAGIRMSEKVHNLKWEQIQNVEDESGIWAMEFHEMIQGRI